jgi:PTS system fructose-specific IIA component
MSDLVNATHVFFDNPATTTEEALEFLAAKGVELGISDDKDALLAAFKEREAQGSTGMVGGFALPHAKSAAVKDVALVVVKFASDIEWKSMDEKPIKAAIAIYVPDDQAGTTHLAVLAKVAAMLMQPDFCSTILESADAEEIAAAINSRLAE